MKKAKMISAGLMCLMLSAFSVFPSEAAEKVTPGDVNGDGTINIVDYIRLKKHFISGADNGNSDEGSDVNSDGAITSADLTALRNILLNVTDPGSSNTEEPVTEYPIDESCILEPKGTIHTGEGTFYGGGYVGGCAMLDPVSTDYWIVAMNLEDYADARLAGAYLEVTGELGTINMLVTDLLPEGKKGDLDLYVDAFPLIAPVEKGRVPVSWKIVPLDIADKVPVSYRFKEGSSEFWCGVQLLDHRYPIAKLEYLNDDGEFVEIERRRYNYFESMEMGPGPFTFRATDIYGQVIVDRDIPLVLDEKIEGKSQFPV
ncbi:MAG: hypothetical protein IJL67_11195 [Oscillospiraceae bacterium]|nr:hypothetical protein [Oscillospiraceae bacterium]